MLFNASYNDHQEYLWFTGLQITTCRLANASNFICGHQNLRNLSPTQPVKILLDFSGTRPGFRSTFKYTLLSIKHFKESDCSLDQRHTKSRDQIHRGKKKSIPFLLDDIKSFDSNNAITQFLLTKNRRLTERRNKSVPLSVGAQALEILSISRRNLSIYIY